LLPDRPYVRRVLLESPLFAVVPSLGPLAAGHSLLCPKAHIRSFAHLDASAFDEFRCLKRVLESALERLYGRIVHVFEHGMGATGNRVLCSVDHAHMHFVPLPESARLQAIDTIPWTPFDGSLEALQGLSGGGEYIYYETPSPGSRLLLPDGPGFASQYMRKLLANALSRGGEWNWRQDPDAPAADAAWRAFVAGRGAMVAAT
jgi:diadenosine tetraphosphate (Ap4A) HIT family hydrolase